MQTPILITGASGFVGANLLRKLIHEVQPRRIHVLLRKDSNIWRINDVLKEVLVHVVDLRSQPATDRLLQKIKPKIIFHLAAHGAYPYQQNDEKEILETNVICTFNLMQACLKVGFNAFINTGTSSEYGINQKPMQENDTLFPVTSYGASKAWSTQYAKYLNFTQKAPITTLRLFGVYGVFEPRGRLVPNLILSLLKKEQPTLVASEFARDFVFVGDVVNAYLCAVENRSQETVFNIGSGVKITLKEIFEVIREIMKVDIEPIIDFSMNDSFDPNKRIADIKLAKKYLGWTPKTDLQDGLQQTVNWFKENRSLYK